MAGDNEDPSVDDDRPSGQVESDDTTQADAGMAGGAGADEDQAVVTPVATEPHAEDEELDED